MGRLVSYDLSEDDTPVFSVSKEYNGFGLLSKRSWTIGSGQEVEQALVYDDTEENGIPDGLLVSMSTGITGDEGLSFEYDPLGRLVSVSGLTD